MRSHSDGEMPRVLVRFRHSAGGTCVARLWCCRSCLRGLANRWIICSGVGALLFLATPACKAQGTYEALTTATNLVRAGQYDAAILSINGSLREHPDDPRLRTVEGLAYSLKGDDVHALLAFRAALRITPGFPAALKAEAQILTTEHSPEAIPVLLEILKTNPHDNTAREMLALAQARAGDCASAITNFEALASTGEKHPDSLLRYGACLFSVGKFSEAATVFSRVAALQPANHDVVYDVALSQAHAGQNKAALDTLTPLLDGTPDIDTLTLASDAAEANGDTPKAAALLRQAIVLDPTLADSYVRFAELCMLHESYKAGIDMVSAGIARLPRSESLFLARGMLYGGKGDYSQAEADFHSAEIFDPKHGTGSYGVGLIQAQANHPAEALATARAALRAHPEDAQLNFLLARTLIDGGEKPGSPGFTEASMAARKAVQLSPDFLPGRNLLAKIYMLTGDPAQSAKQCRAVLKIDPTDQTAIYRLLLAARQIGDTATVRELAERVAQQHQDARNDEGKRLRFRIVDAPEATAAPDTGQRGPTQ